MANQDLIGGVLIDDLGIAGSEVIKAQDKERSGIYVRINSTEGCCAMPPLAKGLIDQEAVQLVANWISSLQNNCPGDSVITLGNSLSDGNFIDNHKPALNINKSDVYTNTSSSIEEVCLTDFSFYARRLGNPLTPFIAQVNGNNDFTILAIGQTRTAAEYSVGNNTFSFSDHSDAVLMLQPGETIATGFIDANPDGSGAGGLSVIPAQSGSGNDQVWQTYTTNSQLPSITLGKSPGLAASVAPNLSRSYKFNIGIGVSESSITPPPPPAPTTTVSFYEDCNYGGNSIQLGEGEYPNITNVGLGNDVLSSLQVPNNFEVTLFLHYNFGGDSLVFTADDACLSDNNFDNTVSSMKIVDIGPPPGVMLFADCSFGGSNIELGVGDYPIITDEGFGNDILSSFKVPAGLRLTVYQHYNFGGYSYEFTADDDCLTDNGIDNDISSIKIDSVAQTPVDTTIDCSSPINVALGKPTNQSSTYVSNLSFESDNAVDGNNSGNRLDNSLTHTQFDLNAWWEVDLGQSYDLSAIKIWNRTDCCSDRLSDFHVLVSEDPFTSTDLTATIAQSGVTDLHFPGTAIRETDFNLSGTGRYVRIQLSGQNALQLAEVEIMGCDVVIPPPPPVDSVCQCASGEISLLVNGSFEETSNPAYNSTFDMIEA
ncbi:MAG: discoidin domain-containing protein, partial [Bacteroidota bacterium]